MTTVGQTGSGQPAWMEGAVLHIAVSIRTIGATLLTPLRLNHLLGRIDPRGNVFAESSGLRMGHSSRGLDSRCQSGIEGLDEILGGGLPSGCFYLIQGDPGSGKTTLALQFLLEGIRRKEKGLYITLSETKAELLRVAESHGWSLQDIPLLDLSAVESLTRPEAQTTVFHASEIELNKVLALLLDETRKINPVRVVFDSLSEFRLMAETALRYRRQLLNLKQEFSKHNSTVLLLDDKMANAVIGSDPHVLSLTHGVIEMEQLSPDYGASRRRLRVMKMRGVKFREGYHDYVISKGGLRTFPRLVAAEHHTEFRRAPVSSGIPELDALFGGGLDRGTTTLILGQAGTGKSTLALQYATQMAGKGERSMVFTFDETRGVMLARTRALGMDVEKYMPSGVLTVQQVDPAEISPGEFASRILRGVEGGCKLVVIDSLNGYLNAMPGERYLNNQLHELSSYLNQQGVVTILILAQHGLVAAAEAPVDLSYLADTVVSLRFFEAAGAVKQALAVIKKRSGHHEKTIREFKLEAGKGLRIGTPLAEFQGVLTGVPVFRGDKKAILNASDAAP
jgi:circadian clock protein KaiC